MGPSRTPTRETLFNMAAANLDAESAINLAVAMGVVEEDSVQAYKAAQILNEKYSTGQIEAMQYQRYLIMLGDALGNLDGMSADMIVNIITRGSLPAGFNAMKGNVSISYDPKTGKKSRDVDKTSPDGNATGADFIVPPGYNDTYPVKVKSGEHVKVTPAGQPNDSGVQLAAILSALNTLDKRIGRSIS